MANLFYGDAIERLRRAGFAWSKTTGPNDIQAHKGGTNYNFPRLLSGLFDERAINDAILNERLMP